MAGEHLRRTHMRRIQLVAALLVCAVIGLPRAGSAQNAPPPTILDVTMDAAGDQITITGTGFGPAPVVTIDGQSVPVLGATDTQVTVITPAVLLTTPGTYRLTVVDSVRQVGEVFVVASHAELAPAVSLTTSGTTPAPSGTGVAPGQPRQNGAAAPILSVNSRGLVGPLVVEDSDSPYTTAIGYQAAANTTGLYNTASGYQALTTNTTGAGNTASGPNALVSNTTGNYNTASGGNALGNNTTGANNTALGYNAGFFATTGNYNLFIGANVAGTAADTNTIRIGLPYTAGAGQNQTFIAGINGTQITNGLPVVVDANGQLGIPCLSVISTYPARQSRRSVRDTLARVTANDVPGCRT
jgi:hypothetical protein